VPASLRWGLVPGVRFDDHVFDITTDRRANDHDHRVGQIGPVATAASRERIVLAWQEADIPGGPIGNMSAYAKVLDANGYEVAAPFRVDQLPAVEGATVLFPPVVAMTNPADPNAATFVVVWVQAAPTGPDGELQSALAARAYDEDGAPLGDVFEVDQAPAKKQLEVPGCPECCAPEPCLAPVDFAGYDIAVRNGGYIVVWSDNADNVGDKAIGTAGLDEQNFNVRGRWLSLQGGVLGDQFRILPPDDAADEDAGPLQFPEVDILPAGGPIAGIVSCVKQPDPAAENTQIEARLLKADGTPEGDPVTVSPVAGREAAPDVAAGPERLLVVWRDETNDNDFQGGPLRERFSRRTAPSTAANSGSTTTTRSSTARSPPWTRRGAGSP